jgi:hypothetical protein
LVERLPQMFGSLLDSAYRILAKVLDDLGRTAEAAAVRRQLDEATGGSQAAV